MDGLEIIRFNIFINFVYKNETLFDYYSKKSTFTDTKPNTKDEYNQ